MINCSTVPDLLTAQPFWLPANQRKIPVLANSDIHITGDRLGYCQNWPSIRQLIEDNIHPWAVYLHNRQEPFIALDLDHARHVDSGQPEDWVMPLFRAIGAEDLINGKPYAQKDNNPYIELSSSGSGYHVLFTGTTDFGKRSWFATNQQGKDCPKIEIIAYNNPLTWTGQQIRGSGQAALPIRLLLDYLQAAYPQQHCESRGSEPGKSTLPPLHYPKHNNEVQADQLADMLDCLDPDCDHDQWKQVGMAIHSWDSTGTGKDLWIQWSQKGKKFNNAAKKAMNTAWKGFTAGKGIGVGTLIKLAMDNGYRFPSKNTDRIKPNDDKRQKTTMAAGQKTTKDVNTQTGQRCPLASITPITDQVAVDNTIKDTIQQMIRHYNRQFVHTRIYNKSRILQLQMDDEHQQMNWISMSFMDFRELLIHEHPVPVSETTDSHGKKKIKTLSHAQLWLTHKNANFIPCSTFYPVVSDEWPPLHNHKLNLYRGLAVQPQPCNHKDTDIQKWLSHVYQIVCQGDEDVYRYLLDWFAHLIQKPHEKPQTAIILKGEQGTGKNATLQPILKILGVHGLYVERSGAVSGKHNKILDNRVLVFADEAAFSNHKDCRVLRALVTERSNIVEPKGIDAYSQQNFIRLIMATNSDSAIRFASDERRFVVLEMSTSHKQDHSYFAALAKANDNALASKLLFLLQMRDIRQFLPMKIPQTRYLSDAKINNLTPEQAFIYEGLMNGSLQYNGGWPQRMDTQTVQRWFQEWLDIRHKKFDGDIGRKLGKVITQIGGQRVQIRMGNDRNYQYQFADLDTSRKDFVKNCMGGSLIKWDAHD